MRVVVCCLYWRARPQAIRGGELENTEGMTNQEGIKFLDRIMNIGDVVILGCNTGFSELEQEKNFPAGSILRQTLRLCK